MVNGRFDEACEHVEEMLVGLRLFGVAMKEQNPLAIRPELAAHVAGVREAALVNPATGKPEGRVFLRGPVSK